MGSGILLLAIVVIWLLFLIPMFIKTYQDNDLESVDSFRSAMNTLNQLSKRKQPASLYTRSAIRAGVKNPRIERDLRLRRKVFASIMLVVVFVIVGIITGNLEFSAIMLPGFAIATYVFWVRSQLRETSSVKKAPAVKARSVRTHSLAALSTLRRQASELLTKTEPELATEATTAWQPLATFDQPEVVLPRYIEYKKEVAIDEPQVEWDATAMLEEAERQRRAQELAALVSDTEVTNVTGADDDTEDIPRVMGA